MNWFLVFLVPSRTVSIEWKSVKTNFHLKIFPAMMTLAEFPTASHPIFFGLKLTARFFKPSPGPGDLQSTVRQLHIVRSSWIILGHFRSLHDTLCTLKEMNNADNENENFDFPWFSAEILYKWCMFHIFVDHGPFKTLAIGDSRCQRTWDLLGSQYWDLFFICWQFLKKCHEIFAIIYPHIISKVFQF